MATRFEGGGVAGLSAGAPHRPVGMVGLGEMGMEMARRLAAAGWSPHCFVRRPEVRTEVVAIGGTDAGSLHAVGEVATVVIVCVFRDDQVREVCLGDEGVLAAMRPGSVLVNHTTGSPRTARELADAAAQRGVGFLDAALSGGPADVAAGRLALLVGGDADVLLQVGDVLSAYADPVCHVGVPGDGQRVKLVNNALFAANLVLVAEAERVAGELGLDPLGALWAITHCSGESRVLRFTAALGSSRAMAEAAGRFVDKDVATIKAVALEAGVDLGLLGMAAAAAAKGGS